MSLPKVSIIMKASTIALVVSFLVGCSPSQDANPPPPVKTVFDPLTQQIGRAREVQKAVDANTDATRDAVDKQERGDAP